MPESSKAERALTEPISAPQNCVGKRPNHPERTRSPQPSAWQLDASNLLRSKIYAHGFCIRTHLHPGPGKFVCPKAEHYGKGPVGLCLDRRPASLARRVTRRICPRDREREKGWLQHVGLVGADLRRRRTPSADKR